MKLGMIVRAEDRGLGNLTWEAWRALDPTVTVAIDMGDWARGFAPHKDRYPAAWWTGFNGAAAGGEHLNVRAIADVFSECDVVWSAETFYDWRLPVELHRRGIHTVLHTMPEFHRPECDVVPNVWLPTPWRSQHHPGAPIVPIGVALDRFAGYRAAPPDAPGPLRVLHVAGHRAAMDRNGTGIVVETVGHLREQVALTIRTQDAEVASPGSVGRVTVETIRNSGGDYWEQYAGFHVLLMPRRYGGLSLPVQEAMAAGLAVVMTACEPNAWWPTERVQAARGPELRAPAGPIGTWTCHPADVAVVLDRLARDRDALARQMAESNRWADAYAWDQVAPIWRDTLTEIVDGS